MLSHQRVQFWKGSQFWKIRLHTSMDTTYGNMISLCWVVVNRNHALLIAICYFCYIILGCRIPFKEYTLGSTCIIILRFPTWEMMQQLYECDTLGTILRVCHLIKNGENEDHLKIWVVTFLPEDQSWVFLSVGGFSCVGRAATPRGQSGTRVENWQSLSWLWFWLSWWWWGSSFFLFQTSP